MAYQKELAAVCGLYCGVCGIYIADRNNDLKFKEKLAPVYGVGSDDIKCKGCLSDEPGLFCKTCSMKSCALEKGFEGCHECGDFPCDFINNFPIPVGKKVIMRAVPARRELGTAKWIEEEEKRYHCKCGASLFRGAKRCRECREPVDVD